MNIREIAGMAPVIPVLRITEIEHAVPLARALVAGGLKALEIALGTRVALAGGVEMLRALAESCPDVGFWPTGWNGARKMPNFMPRWAMRVVPPRSNTHSSCRVMAG